MSSKTAGEIRGHLDQGEAKKSRAKDGLQCFTTQRKGGKGGDWDIDRTEEVDSFLK